MFSLSMPWTVKNSLWCI